MSARRPGGKGHGSKKKGKHSARKGKQRQNRRKKPRFPRVTNTLAA